MPSPPPAPPAAAEDEKRLSPLMRMKLLFPYAVNRMFGGMGRAWGMAFIGLNFLICVLKVVSFTTDPEARSWVPIFRFWVYLGLAAIMLMTCGDFFNCVYGLYTMKLDPPQQQPVAAAVQLPPPPPEMDMC